MTVIDHGHDLGAITPAEIGDGHIARCWCGWSSQSMTTPARARWHHTQHAWTEGALPDWTRDDIADAYKAMARGERTA